MLTEYCIASVRLVTECSSERLKLDLIRSDDIYIDEYIFTNIYNVFNKLLFFISLFAFDKNANHSQILFSDIACFFGSGVIVYNHKNVIVRFVAHTTSLHCTHFLLISIWHTVAVLIQLI